MRRSLTAGIAFLAATSLPLVAVSPAAAWAPDLSTFTFDCDDHLLGSWDLPIYGTSVTLEFQDCDPGLSLIDVADTGNASTTEGTIEDVIPRTIATTTVTGQVQITLWVSEVESVATINFIDAWDLPDPTGSQLATGHQDFDATPLAATWGTPSEVSNGDEIQLDEIEGCEIMPGEHIYATQTFTVSTAGDYTFRVTGVDPYPEYLDPFDGADYELEDPMVALYSSFSTSDPADGIVGCNDDLNDLVFGGHDYGDNDFNLSAQGDYIEGHYSYFTATLDPGEYTLVFTTWGDVSADDWAAESPNTGRVYFDAWGPSDGLELTDGPSGSGGSNGGKLADTGFDPSFALWAAVFLVGTGVAITIARRRTQIH